jgi:hypothetical protein
VIFTARIRARRRTRVIQFAAVSQSRQCAATLDPGIWERLSRVAPSNAVRGPFARVVSAPQQCFSATLSQLRAGMWEYRPRGFQRSYGAAGGWAYVPRRGSPASYRSVLDIWGPVGDLLGVNSGLLRGPIRAHGSARPAHAGQKFIP